jgi:ankyrin repeat protein
MAKAKIHPNVWAAYVTALATVTAASLAVFPKLSCGAPETKANALVDQKDPNNWTPLYRAARDNNTSGVSRLLSQGADPNTADNHGWTPIFQAARRGNPQMVRDLMAKGAAIDVASDLKETPLHLAAASGDVDTVRAVATDRSGNTIVNVNAEDVHGKRPLHFAAKAGREEVVKLLLYLGAEDSKDEDGHLAQDLAANGKCRDLIKDSLPKKGRGNPFKIKL